MQRTVQVPIDSSCHTTYFSNFDDAMSSELAQNRHTSSSYELLITYALCVFDFKVKPPNCQMMSTGIHQQLD
jgi:hypothetical protein